MEQLSVVIITYNEEAKIGNCIDSVKAIADEIIILDSYSSDNTVKIAQSKGARVWQQSFAGYIGQKNKALSLASNRFVLSLDADEVVSEKLSQSILKAKETFTYGAYRMNRCANYCGKFIRYGTWYPNRKIRLFDKGIGYWGGINPHDKVVFNQPVAVKQLEGEILHYSFKNVEDHQQQNKRFATIAAQSLYEAGKRTNRLKVILNPAWAFINGYIFHAGFLLGKTGLTISINQSRYTYMKHRKLFRLAKDFANLKVPMPVIQRQLKDYSDIQAAANTDRLARDVRTHVGS